MIRLTIDVKDESDQHISDVTLKVFDQQTQILHEVVSDSPVPIDLPESRQDDSLLMQVAAAGKKTLYSAILTPDHDASVGVTLYAPANDEFPVYISSQPESGIIWTDHRMWLPHRKGFTPQVLYFPIPGSWPFVQDISISKQGYETDKGTLTIQENETGPYAYSAVLAAVAVKKRVRFESAPSDAEVYVDTVLQGTTALGLYMLPKDNYDIKITKTGYEDHIGTLSVHADDPDPIVYAATLQEEVPETFTISFVVVDTNNNPVSGATIRIQDTSGNTVETLTTDSAGAASASLQDANYDFYLSKTGYTWTDTDLGWIRIGVDADQDVTWTMDEDVVLPEPPHKENYFKNTWKDPQYWADMYNINVDIPAPPEFNLVKDYGAGYKTVSIDDPKDTNKYIIGPEGELYIKDPDNIFSKAYSNAITDLRAFLGWTTTPPAETDGDWYDLEENELHRWSSRKTLWKLSPSHPDVKIKSGFAVKNVLGRGTKLYTFWTRAKVWTIDTPGVRMIWRWSPVVQKYIFAGGGLAVGGVVAWSSFSQKTLQAFAIPIFIESIAMISEWGIEETIGGAGLACYAAKDLSVEVFEKAVNRFELVLKAGKEIHKVTGINRFPIPQPDGTIKWGGLSPVIDEFLFASDSQLLTYKAILATKKGTESPLINWIIAGNRTTITVDVERVIDGDTIDIKKVVGTEILDGRIRLLGIDMPEKFSALGEKAMTYMRSLMEGSTVTLKLDIGRIYGTYRRILAVVYVSGRCLQLDLLEKGYARVALKGENLALDEIMPEDLTGPHPHGILYYADKDFGWNAKLATFNLHGVEPGATVEVKELPLKKVDVKHGGVYKIIVGDEVKIASVKDRSEKDINI